MTCLLRPLDNRSAMPTRDPLLSRIAHLISDVTGAEPTSLSESSCANNTQGWDSIASLSIIGAIEEEFGLIIGTAEAIRLSSIDDFIQFVRTRAPLAGDPPRG